MILDICTYGNPILAQKGAKVQTFDASLKGLIADMYETLYHFKGVGLAAQQVGRAIQISVIDLQLGKVPKSRLKELCPHPCVFDGKETPVESFGPFVIINPIIEKTSPETDVFPGEGCLSIPGVRGDVVRPLRVTVKYQDADGQEHTLEGDGLLGECLQHEIDHLNGILFIERMSKKARKSIQKQLDAFEIQYAVSRKTLSSHPKPQ